MQKNLLQRPVWSLSAFLFISILFIGCNSKAKKEIPLAFSTIQQHVKDIDKEKIIASLDAESIAYLDKMAALSNNWNYEEVSALGKKYQCELTTLLLHEYMLMFNDSVVDTTKTKKVDKEDVVSVAGLMGTGILQFLESDRFTYKDLEKVRGKQASANIRMNVGDNTTFIVSQCLFNKQDDAWKLNLLSTFLLDEKLLEGQQRSSGRTKVDFISAYAKDQPSEVRFSYMK